MDLIKIEDIGISSSISNLNQNFITLFQHEVNTKNPTLPVSYLKNFFHKCLLHGADPRLDQIFLICRNDSKMGHDIATVVFSYHFLLQKAHSTGQLEGLTCECKAEETFDPFTGKFKPELVATASIKRTNKGETVFKARWSEFFQPYSGTWKKMPNVMLQKVAIANVLRWAFPDQLGAIYMKEEIPEADPEVVEKRNQNTAKRTKDGYISEINRLLVEVTKPMQFENDEAKRTFMLERIGISTCKDLPSKSDQELTTIIEKLKVLT